MKSPWNPIDNYQCLLSTKHPTRDPDRETRKPDRSSRSPGKLLRCQSWCWIIFKNKSWETKYFQMGHMEKRYISSNPFFKWGGTAAVIFTQTCELFHLSQSRSIHKNHPGLAFRLSACGPRLSVQMTKQRCPHSSCLEETHSYSIGYLLSSTLFHSFLFCLEVGVRESLWIMWLQPIPAARVSTTPQVACVTYLLCNKCATVQRWEQMRPLKLTLSPWGTCSFTSHVSKCGLTLFTALHRFLGRAENI